MNGGMYVIVWSMIDDGATIDTLITKFPSDEEARLYADSRLVDDDEVAHVFKVQHEVL